jgi:hypothetical protein
MAVEFELLIDEDSGLLGLVDAAAYQPFVAEDWTYQQLLARFAQQMEAGALLVWACGDGGDRYRVVVRDHFTAQRGFREATGLIVPSTERLHLASYTALTMAAQFPEYAIPGRGEEHLAISVTPGPLRTRVVQLYDPDSASSVEGGPHFLLELEPGAAPTWSAVAWHDA